MKSALGWVITATLLALGMNSAVGQSAAENCHSYAGEKQHGGVWFHELNVETAIPSCRNAVAVAPDDERSITNLARSYLKSGDYQAAKKLLSSVSGPFRGRALNMLAYMLENGLGSNVDHRAAFDTYRLAAETGYIPAQYNLGEKHQMGTGTPVDFSKARFWYLKAAAQGNAYAQNNLGHMFGTGIGGVTNGEAARLWFERAAEQGFGDALSNLADYYHSGKFTEPAPKEALAYAQRAAEQDNVHGLHILGQFYLEGFAVEQDYATASRLFSKGAKQGHAQNQFKLGWMAENGWGQPADLRKAAVWYLKAAKQGHAWAQFNLAQLHERGAATPNASRETPRDLRKAELYYRMAAEQDLASAQDHLAALHLRISQFDHFRSDAIRWRMLAYAGSSDSHLHQQFQENPNAETLKDLRQALISFGGRPKDTSISELEKHLNEWSKSDKPGRLLNFLSRSR